MQISNVGVGRRSGKVISITLSPAAINALKPGVAMGFRLKLDPFSNYNGRDVGTQRFGADVLQLGAPVLTVGGRGSTTVTGQSESTECVVGVVVVIVRLRGCRGCEFVSISL